jgi:3-isopropylmalate/(R)-2-methylmalate dehydratase large subunit
MNTLCIRSHDTPTPPRTLTQKILAAHGVEDLTPGAFALARVDRVMLNDVSGAVSIREFEKMGAERVFDPSRVACVADHFWPAKDARSAALVARLRTFAQRYGIEDYYEVGATVEAGIEHTVLAEQGRVLPGDLLLGADSHTCTTGAFGAFATGMGSSDVAAALALGEIWIKVPETVRVAFTGELGPHVTGKDLILAYIGQSGVDGATYASLEFTGETVAGLGLEERLALCNMAVEAGAKAGMVAADETTLAWLRERVPDTPAAAIGPDPDAVYDHHTTISMSGLRPLVAAPSSPGNVVAIDELGGDVPVHQVYVGNCANGTLTDLRQLASVVQGHRVAPGVRLIVVPATQRVYRDALREGIVETLLEAGAMISPPTCGACFGGHNGILDAGETAVATTNRNFRGRMGDPESSVYLANAYVAGAAAITGTLVDPAEVAA